MYRVVSVFHEIYVRIIGAGVWVVKGSFYMDGGDFLLSTLSSY